MKAKELMNDGIIGDILRFEANAFSSDFFATSSTQAKKARGGVLRDLGSHVIDLTLWLFKDISIIRDTVSVSLDNAAFSVIGPNNSQGYFRISWAEEGYRMPEIRIKVAGTKGLIEVNDDYIVLKDSSGELRTWYRADLNDNVPFLLGMPEYYREDEYFINCILQKNRPSPDFFEASKVDHIISEVERYAFSSRG